MPLVNFFQTPLYGVKNYHVEIVANSESQVKDTFKVAYDMLHDNPKFKGKFSVTKELITNLATGSEMKYNTSNAKTKDGKRTGCLVLNEIHAYENYDQINVFEALIIPLSGKYYRATSWSHTNEVMMKRVYKDVMLSCGDENLTIFSTFQSDEVIHLRYDNARIRLYLQNVVGQFDKTMDSINAMMQLSSQPRFKLKLGTNALSFREKQADGTDKVMTRDQYVLKIKKLLTSDDLEVLTEQENASVEQMQINTTVKAEELAKMALQINNEVANAFDIPEAVFNGNITEKSDATNEFITYAVSPIAEVINDTLTAYVVGENDYCRKNEKVMVWLARFKHVDVVDSAVNLDKLRGIGFHLDEIREMVGYPLLNTEFSTERALTKNYGGEGNSNAAQET